MTARPLISVVTATYNMSQFIEAAVESVIAQTYENLQYVIIDDGSTDGTSERISKFLKDPRLEYHYQDNQGQTVAKNNGIRLARGDYICFLDADNIWLSDKLEKQLRTFSTIPSHFKILYADQLYINDKGIVIGKPSLETHSGRIADKLLFENFVTFNTAMVERTCFEELGPFDESLDRSIDYELWLRFSRRYEFYHLSEVTTYYRIWEGQMSRDTERRFDAALGIMEKFLEENPGFIDPQTIRRAWNHAFTARGRYSVSQAKFSAATKSFLRALRYNIASWYTWKSIAKMVIPFSR